MQKDLIFVFFWGSMSGVFGAGVVTSLQALDIYPRIHSMYASSAGAHNAAYFLAEDTKLGSRIYYEDLIDNKFIRDKKVSFLYRILASCFNKAIPLEKLVDIDYLMQVEKEEKILQTQKIIHSKIPFFMRVYNIRKRTEEYVDGKTDVFRKLKATSAVVPFYPHTVKIDNVLYSDGDTIGKIIDPILEKVIKENPDKKVVLVFNTPRKSRLSRNARIGDILWTIFLFIFFRSTFVFEKLKFVSENKKLDYYCSFPNVVVIEPDIDFPVLCTNRTKLLELYANGKEKGMMIMKKILSTML